MSSCGGGLRMMAAVALGMVALVWGRMGRGKGKEKSGSGM